MSKAGTTVKRKEERKRAGGKLARPEVLRSCETMVAAQMRPGEIARRLSAEFHISERQCHRYIAAVNVSLVAENEETRPLRKNWLRLSFQAVYRRAMSSDQLGAATQALDRLARLDGLYEEARVGVEHSGSISSTNGVLLVAPVAASAEEWIAAQGRKGS